MSPVFRHAARRVLVAFALILVATGFSRAQDKPLDAAVLKKVKAATVSLQVKLHDGRTVTGSGFLTDEPGLVVTNAHVLNMLDADSRKPLKVEVTIHSGTEQSKTLAGTVIGVDRSGDLGLVRIEPKGLPDPLPLGSASTLNETDNVFVFGFPFGDNLGKEITVSKASVASLRKNAAGTLNRVQLQGGLNPGNSGGPVVDSKGSVVGVAVSGIRGSQIGFAIPAEHVGPFLNGRIVESGIGQAYKDGDKMYLPVTFAFVDPLSRLKKVEVEIWTAKAGPPRPGGPKEPAAQPGDSSKIRFVMKYDGTGTAKIDALVPPLPPGQVYWFRPVITNGKNTTLWVTALTAPPSYPLERKAMMLAYNPPASGKQTAEVVSQGSFRLRDEDGQEHSLSVDFRTAYTESFGKAARKVIPVRLSYDQFFLTLKMDNKPLPGDANIRKWLVDARLAGAELELDSDGSLATGKPDLTRVSKEAQPMWEDLSDQVINSIEVLSVPLPGRKVNATETWKARRNLVIGSAVLAVPVQADLVYEFMGVRTIGKEDFAMISIGGTIRGRRGDGGDVGGGINGTALLSLETGEVMTGRVSLKADVDIAFERKKAKAVGTLNVNIRRPAPPPMPEKK